MSVALCSAGLLAATSCSDYLETGSPSTVTVDVVMSSYDNCRSAVDGTYTSFHNVLLNQTFGAGLFYALDAAGSDIERHPEGYSAQPTRHQPESFYEGGKSEILAAYNPVTYGKEAPSSAFSMLFSIITTTNTLTSGITETQLKGEKAREYKQIYAEAMFMKALCYRELIKYYGDVPMLLDINDTPDKLTSRLDIYAALLPKLQACVDDLPVITATNKTTITKQFGYATIGRIALEAAGYQTFRLDVTSADRLEKHPDYTDSHDATYARAKNYKDYYKVAYDAFYKVVNDPGAVIFDPNDYSKFFTQLHGDDNVYADESLFEDEQLQGADGNDERPYSIGRPATGASSNNYPCKSYGQSRINPAFYYGMFDPRDVRRDISCVITGTTNTIGLKKGGYEFLMPFTPASQAKGGGIACGKFDENRQNTIWTKNQRRSGINAPFMRISEVYLGLAEAALMIEKPDVNTAVTYYNKTRLRAGLDAATTTVTFEEVIDERGFEFAGEGDRRWTLIRTGLIGKKVAAIRKLTSDMIAGLRSAGEFKFANENVIGSKIYYKYVDPKSTEVGVGKRLMPATPASMRVPAFEPANDAEAVQFPGWRGQHEWENVFADIYASDSKSNLAIKGLFTNITETPEGYTAMDWGAELVKQEAEYSTYLFNGWDCKSAPIYLFPLTTNALIGGITNGYGFGQGW